MVGVSSVQELITDGLQEVLRISVISALFILAAMLMLSVLLSQMLSETNPESGFRDAEL